MKYIFYIKDENTQEVDSKIYDIDILDGDGIEKMKNRKVDGKSIVKIKPLSEINLNDINPEVEPGDRVRVIYMQGESYETTGGIEFGETNGKVIKKVNQPKFTPSDPGFGYYVEWFNDEGETITKLPLFPESDGWLYDVDFYQSSPESLNENMFRNIDDLVSWGDFFAVFTKGELEKVCEFLELERRSGFSNMYTEGGRFLLTGPDYIKAFLNLRSFERTFEDEDKILHKIILSRADEVRNIFIRNAMKYLENKDEDLETSQIQRAMVRLAQTSKKYWMQNADKYINKEIE